jgi:hypothetical protein
VLNKDVAILTPISCISIRREWRHVQKNLLVGATMLYFSRNAKALNILDAMAYAQDDGYREA